MGPPPRRTFIIILTISLVALVLFLSYSDDSILPDFQKPVLIKWLGENGGGFVLNTPGCQIPEWDPYDPSVLHLIKKVKSPYKCPGRPPFMKAKPNAVVSIDYNLLRSHYGVLQKDILCTYRPILRDPGPENDRTDNKYLLGNFRKLEFGVAIKDEFIVVNCSMRGYPNLKQFIPLVPLKPSVENVKTPKISSTSKDGHHDHLNIIIVGVDSISKLNFLRHFHKTQKYLKQNTAFFEFKGYTKVADNTFPNLVPLLTGHFIENYWNESVKNIFFDDVDFVWKNYSERGYRTLYAEDAPRIATFNYLKKGFRNPPADYYFRPFALALENSPVMRKSKAHCLDSIMEIEILYSYLKDFVKTMDKRPYFAFTFVTRLTHDILNNAGYADDPTYHLLKDLNESGALNRSLLILLSDHGIRFGNIRQTYIGKFEERMPFIFLTFPPWFLKKHPEFEKNLRENQNRLTTPFDIHATLVHLLNITRQQSSELNETLARLTPHGISLMDPIPKERTCEEASILPHWCVCQTHKPVPVTEPVVVNSAVALVDSLNKILKPFEEFCTTLRLKEVMDARFGQANDMVLRFVKHQNDVINRHVVLGRKINGPVDYLIVVKVDPSGGIFEGTVRFNAKDSTYKVLDDISRLNVYGNQSICIDSARMRKFCFCKSQTLFHKTARGTAKNTSSV